MKYYNVCWNELNMYECKADNKDDTEISFRINVSSNVRRYKILKIKRGKILKIKGVKK